uniref:Uncharacterized protein n=1 Tax=Arion vulgaris TaxID=1028688 RepID=A0A0B7ALL6_9EUPU
MVPFLVPASKLHMLQVRIGKYMDLVVNRAVEDSIQQEEAALLQSDAAGLQLT